MPGGTRGLALPGPVVSLTSFPVPHPDFCTQPGFMPALAPQKRVLPPPLLCPAQGQGKRRLPFLTLLILQGMLWTLALSPCQAPALGVAASWVMGDMIGV